MEKLSLTPALGVLEPGSVRWLCLGEGHVGSPGLATAPSVLQLLKAKMIPWELFAQTWDLARECPDVTCPWRSA